MKTLLPIILLAVTTSALADSSKVNLEEVKKYDPITEIGCTKKEPDDRNIINIVCRSKISGESAWNAAMYHAKFACESQLYDVLFEKNPTLPLLNGVHGVQVQLKCAIRP